MTLISMYICSGRNQDRVSLVRHQTLRVYVLLLDCDDVSRVKRIHRTRAAMTATALVYIERYITISPGRVIANDLFLHAACGCACPVSEPAIWDPHRGVYDVTFPGVLLCMPCHLAGSETMERAHGNGGGLCTVASH
jgi:hypothetical protein